MTKEQAIRWMELGARCTHRYFGTGEWVTIKEDGTTYLLEDGVECTPEEFWRYRSEAHWGTNWGFDGDPYSCIASREFGCPLEKVSGRMRSLIKMKYFSLMYGH